MKNRYLICSDLDRTLIPNGDAPESERSRAMLRKLASLPGLTLAYVSGRNERLIREAVDAYQLPPPRYAVGDVGTTIYTCEDTQWTPLADWSERISVDWPSGGRDVLIDALKDFPELEMQEEDKQNRFKLSYYTPTDFGESDQLPKIKLMLSRLNADLELIWSIDEAAQTGLLDILPKRATKLGAVRFLMDRENVTHNQTVFAGDSGNDLPVLTSEIQSVLVANARDEIKRRAAAEQEAGRLYTARGAFHGLNGNYAAGVIEGICHFLPEIEDMIF